MKIESDNKIIFSFFLDTLDVSTSGQSKIPNHFFFFFIYGSSHENRSTSFRIQQPGTTIKRGKKKKETRFLNFL